MSDEATAETPRGGGNEKDPEEQAALARDLGQEVADSFERFTRGELSFAELTFLTYEALEDVYSIAAGDYELETGEDDEGAAYSPQTAVMEQEDLAQEPARDKPSA